MNQNGMPEGNLLIRGPQRKWAKKWTKSAGKGCVLYAMWTHYVNLGNTWPAPLPLERQGKDQVSIQRQCCTWCSFDVDRGGVAHQTQLLTANTSRKNISIKTTHLVLDLLINWQQKQ